MWSSGIFDFFIILTKKDGTAKVSPLFGELLNQKWLWFNFDTALYPPIWVSFTNFLFYVCVLMWNLRKYNIVCIQFYVECYLQLWNTCLMHNLAHISGSVTLLNWSWLFSEVVQASKQLVVEFSHLSKI